MIAANVKQERSDSNQFELVVKYSKALEHKLRDIGTPGRGLGTLTSRTPLPGTLRRKLFEINRTRNAVLHETRRLNTQERQSFRDKAEDALHALEQYAATSKYHHDRDVWEQWMATAPSQLDMKCEAEIRSALRDFIDDRSNG